MMPIRDPHRQTTTPRSRAKFGETEQARFAFSDRKEDPARAGPFPARPPSSNEVTMSEDAARQSPRSDAPAGDSKVTGHRVLVAGATGTLGRHVIRELVRRGEHVRALVRDPYGPRAHSLGSVELFAGDLLDRESLGGACDDVDVVISCAGASMLLGRLTDRRSFMEVDFGGNANLLEIARTAGVAKFVYVSLFGARDLLRTEYAAAHERFVGALQGSGMAHTIVRPTGFFSFFSEMLDMAARGRVLLIGDGHAHTNPIDERDVAQACADAILLDEPEVAIGGPDVLSRRQIAELAFQAIGKPARISSISPATFLLITRPLSLVNRRLHALCAFGAAVSTIEVVAPRIGHRTLSDYFREGGASANAARPAAARTTLQAPA